MPTTLSRPQTLHRFRDDARLVGRMTPAQYHAFNHEAARRHELIEGEVIRMAGVSVEHNQISTNTQFELTRHLRGEGSQCEVYVADQKVYVNTEVFFYPDLVVIPPKPQYDQNDALRNPVAVFEVLSSSTEDFDKDEKFEYYKQIESLRHYVLIDQSAVSVTHYEKNAHGVWVLIGIYQNRADTFVLFLDDAQITVSVGEMYRKVSFDE